MRGVTFLLFWTNFCEYYVYLEIHIGVKTNEILKDTLFFFFLSCHQFGKS